MRRQPHRLPALAGTFGRLHAEVHWIRGLDGLPLQAQRYRCALQEGDYLPRGLAARLLDRLEGMADPGLLCHGDFSPTNVLVNGRRSHAIDFQDGHRGDPSGDVAETWIGLGDLAFRPGAAPRFEALWLRAFLPAYLRAYRRHRALDEATLLDWIAIVAAAQGRGADPARRRWLVSLVTLHRQDPGGLRRLVLG
jgi:Ser/Thr protein kinase RdoA (MazF antagonist)